MVGIAGLIDKFKLGMRPRSLRRIDHAVIANDFDPIEISVTGQIEGHAGRTTGRGLASHKRVVDAEIHEHPRAVAGENATRT